MSLSKQDKIFIKEIVLRSISIIVSFCVLPAIKDEKRFKRMKEEAEKENEELVKVLNKWTE